MVQEFNTDIVGKLDAVMDTFHDGLLTDMRNGMEAAAECAKSSGATKLQKSCEAACEGVEQMIKVMESLMESCENYAAHIKKLNGAIGGE